MLVASLVVVFMRFELQSLPPFVMRWPNSLSKPAKSPAAFCLPSATAMSAISPTHPTESPIPSAEDSFGWPLDELRSRELGHAGIIPSARPSQSQLKLWRSFGRGVSRRWQRELRRRKVGRAYDMALEIARMIPAGSRVLDVGCGNGYIAHHLSALLGSGVTGIDVTASTEARIPYWQFDGQKFPVKDRMFDAALFCYVLHHAQGLRLILAEARRALCEGGLLVVYEDIPEQWWDRIVCMIHDRKWRRRTGPCTFLDEREWRETFASEGFELCSTRRISRWRKVVHPVSRRLFVLKKGQKLDARC